LLENEIILGKLRKIYGVVFDGVKLAAGFLAEPPNLQN
jgi:hypothetical protein